MMERTGSRSIFAEIAAASARGLSFPAWLAESGRKHKLAASVPRLQQEWQAWIKDKYGKGE